MTNADRIRNMTNEMMAKMFYDIVDCSNCKIAKSTPSVLNWCAMTKHGCEDRWLEWLEEIAKDD